MKTLVTQYAEMRALAIDAAGKAIALQIERDALEAQRSMLRGEIERYAEALRDERERVRTLDALADKYRKVACDAVNERDEFLNDRLKVAAPTLLAACSALVLMGEDLAMSDGCCDPRCSRAAGDIRCDPCCRFEQARAAIRKAGEP